MNNWDRDNLNFLLNTSPAVLQQWYDQADEDDLAYAMELLKTAQAELAVWRLELDEQEDHQDLTLARAVLSKFQL